MCIYVKAGLPEADDIDIEQLDRFINDPSTQMYVCTHVVVVGLYCTLNLLIYTYCYVIYRELTIHVLA